MSELPRLEVWARNITKPDAPEILVHRSTWYEPPEEWEVRAVIVPGDARTEAPK